MRILLTNDDGIDAPGLALLAEIVAEFAQPVIVAPEHEMSECGHRITTKRDLRLSRIAPDRYCLDGLPADCVRIGLTHVCPAAQWVLSGVNDGGNLGVDIFRSGTVAAAREATILERPAMALSQYRRGDAARNWRTLAPHLRQVLSDYLRRPPGQETLWNVNFPALQDLTATTAPIECAPDHNPLPVEYTTDGEHFHYAGVYANRKRATGSDVDVCFSGQIAISRLPLFPSESQSESAML